MKILAFSFYFPPHGGPGALRPLKLLKYAARLGAEGVVISADKDDYPILDESLLAEIPREFLTLSTPKNRDPLRLLRKKMPNVIHAPSSDLFFLPDNKIWWIDMASRLGIKSIESPDIVWATCPPFSAALAARRAAKELKVPLVLDFRDSWTKNPNRKRLPAPHRIINRYLAAKACNSADLITCVYNSIASEIIGYAPTANIHILPNGYDPSDRPEETTPINDDGLNICYLGTIYPDLNYPLEFLQAMVKLPKTHLKIVGRYPQRVAEDAKRLGISDRVELLGYKNHKEALAITSSADALLLYIDNRSLNCGQVTSKTYEYMGLGRPIIACIPRGGEAESVLKDYSAAYPISTGSVSALVRTLKQLSAKKKEGALKRVAPPPEFDRKLIAEKWFELIKDIKQ
ncbi:glycosyltransferase [bacterium]|nr:glycosyltransferase [bacterium]